MKRIYSFIAVVLLSTIALHAEVLLEEEVTFGTKWDTYRVLNLAAAPSLENAQTGDLLTVTVTAVDNEATDGPQIAIQGSSWKNLDTNFGISFSTTGVKRFALTDSAVAQVNTGGIIIKGINCTISKVELLYHKTLWEGPIGGNDKWAQSSEIDNSVFDDLEVGSVLGVNITYLCDTFDWHHYNVRGRVGNDWDHIENIVSQDVYAVGTYLHELTANQVDSLQAKHIDVSAQYLTVAALYAYEETKGVVPAGVTDTIWTGEKDFGTSWSLYEQLAATKFTNAVEGQYLCLCFKDLRAGAQMSLSYPGATTWHIIPGTTSAASLNGKYIQYEIDKTMLDTLQEKGLIVSGHRFTLTKIILINPADLKTLTLSVPVTDNWVYTDKPSIKVHVENPYDEAVTANVVVEIATDKLVALDTVLVSQEVAANGSKDIIVTTEANLAAGFYKATCYVNDDLARAFFFGINPTAIVSATDKQADFASYWTEAKAQLDAIAINATLTEITAKSTSNRKVYLVEMQSIPDGLSGDPVTIRGYYAEPTDGLKHPVIMHYQGYDSGYRPGGEGNTPYCMNGDAEPNYAEFILSTRGQSVNNRPAADREDGIDRDFTNTYGDWFAFEFGNKDAYYYRGAYMDCVRAIQFMASRETSDMNNLYAEGQSQGGAFTYAAAYLSGYTFRAIAPAIAFMGDFPDYFDIVNWPASVARENQGEMTDDEMFAFLSYYDTKNLAATISCPIIACIGVQDNVCPPHTNIAPYNNALSTDKELIFNPENAHQAGATWYNDHMKFFQDREDKGGTTDVESIVNRQSSNRKVLRDGQLVIFRDGVAYTILGQKK